MKRAAPPLLLLIFCGVVAGCAPRAPAIPTVRFSNTREAMQILADRTEAVGTMTAQGLITLARPDGESVRFDLAMVRHRDKGVRLRAWKLGRAVFDLTMTPDGAWLLTPDDPSLKQKVRSAGVSARKLLETWELFNGEAFRSGEGKLTDHGHLLSYVDGKLHCVIDRRTLTPFDYSIRDDAGQPRFQLYLDDYRLIDGIPVAHRYSARSDDGSIRIVLRDVELNTELAPNAFRPPRRAEKLP